MGIFLRDSIEAIFGLSRSRGGRGSGPLPTPPLPLKNHKNIGSLSNSDPDPLKITKPPSPHLMLSHHRFAGGPMMVFGSGIWIQIGKKLSKSTPPPSDNVLGSAHEHDVNSFSNFIDGHTVNFSVVLDKNRPTCTVGCHTKQVADFDGRYNTAIE